MPLKTSTGKNVTRYNYICTSGRYITNNYVSEIKALPQHFFKSHIKSSEFHITIPNRQTSALQRLNEIIIIVEEDKIDN